LKNPKEPPVIKSLLLKQKENPIITMYNHTTTKGNYLKKNKQVLQNKINNKEFPYQNLFYGFFYFPAKLNLT